MWLVAGIAVGAAGARWLGRWAGFLFQTLRKGCIQQLGMESGSSSMVHTDIIMPQKDYLWPFHRSSQDAIATVLTELFSTYPIVTFSFSLLWFSFTCRDTLWWQRVHCLGDCKPWGNMKCTTVWMPSKQPQWMRALGDTWEVCLRVTKMHSPTTLLW
jgi:hypothetical protein